MIAKMLFDNWWSLLRVLLVGASAYTALVLLLRLSGKRTLSKMNVFDLVVTVALGSTLASVITSKGVALAEGVLAFVMLISLQFVVAWLSVRSSVVSKLVKADPRLLFYAGEYLHENMKDERVTQVEVLAAIRASGKVDLNEVGAVVLETDGSFTVMHSSQDTGRSALANVRHDG